MTFNGMDFFRIEFSDDSQYDSWQNVINSTLAEIFEDEKYTLEFLEELLFKIQSWIQPLVEQILSLESMQPFAELKETAGCIQKAWQNNGTRPYLKLEDYTNMCQVIGSIVGEYDETSQLSWEEVELLQNEFYHDIESRDDFSIKIASSYSYCIFESLYYFIDYFYSTSNREEAIQKVLYLADNILFEVLWHLEQYSDEIVGGIGFIEATQQLFSVL